MSARREAALVAVLTLASLIVLSSASLCVSSEPYVDCNFHSLSSPSWKELSELSAELTAAWKAAVAHTPAYPARRFYGRGLVITATKLDMVNVPVLLNTLRSEKFDLPVEIWYSGDFSTEVIGSLLHLSDKLVVKNVANYALAEDLKTTITSQGEHVFQAKLLAILHSAFEEVLFLDADNIPISNPAVLFESTMYQTTGAIFWPDFWHTATANPIWRILEVEPQGWEQESGQIVVDKRRGWAALNLAFFFAKDPVFQQLINGDKEAFRLAFLATRTPAAMITTPVAIAGATTDEGGFCGHTMVQHCPAGAPLFLHHNSLKHGAAITWELMKSVPPGENFSLVPLPPANINNEPISCLDLAGASVESTPAPFSSFEVMMGRRQAAVDPALRSISHNEFLAVVETTRRKLLQGNNTLAVPAPTAPGGGIDRVNGCPNGGTLCDSRFSITAVCCINGCSNVYENEQNPNVDSPQYCASATGGIDVPTPAPGSTPPPASVPSPTTSGGGIDFTASCDAGYTRCTSRFDLTAECCSVANGGCSGVYANRDPTVDSPQLCAAPNGGVDLGNGSTIPVPTTPSPSALLSGKDPATAAPGSTPNPNAGPCPDPNFNQPCTGFGSGAATICCPTAYYQCAPTDSVNVDATCQRVPGT